MATPLVEIVEEIPPHERVMISAIWIEGDSARVLYAIFGDMDHDRLTDHVDWDRVIDSGFRGRVLGRERKADTVHPIPDHTDAVLESWIDDLRGSGLVGGMRVQRTASGHTSIGTHWSTDAERMDWLRGLDD